MCNKIMTKWTSYSPSWLNAYERRSLIITTNLVFSAWDRIFKDPMTTLAAVDRVVHHAVILDMTGVESFRVQQARQEQLEKSPSLAAEVSAEAVAP